MFERRTALERVFAALRWGMRVGESRRKSIREENVSTDGRMKLLVRIVRLLKLIK